MKDTVVGTSDTSIDGRSVGPVHRRWRQWLAEPEVSQGGKDLGFIGHTSREERAGGFIVTILLCLVGLIEPTKLLFNRTEVMVRLLAFNQALTRGARAVLH